MGNDNAGYLPTEMLFSPKFGGVETERADETEKRGEAVGGGLAGMIGNIY